MKEIILTNGDAVLVDNEDYEGLSSYTWNCLRLKRKWGIKKYATRTARHGTSPNRLIYMHRNIMNAPRGLCVDHIDHNGLNNTKSNLRLATHSQNIAHNQNVGCSTGYYGVSEHSSGRGYYVRCGEDYVGYFMNAESAARAYDKYAQNKYGEFAKRNFT